MHKALILSTFIIGQILLSTTSINSVQAAPPTMQEMVNEMDPSQILNMGQYINSSVPRSAGAAGCNITGTCTTDQGTVIGYGALPEIGKGVAYLATSPPIQSHQYLADLFNNINPTNQAYAQGIGFSGLSPVLELWKIFRNIAYTIYIVIFMVIGIMIMLRRKIDAQTVVSVQTALPKLIVTLILITFSYAIAGLVIDLMYLSIYAIVGIFAANGIVTSPQTLINNLFGENIIAIGYKYFMGRSDIANIASNSLGGMVEQILNTGILTGIASSILYLVIAVSLLIAMVRTLFTLITSYVGIILSTIIAPAHLLLNAFPGSNTFNSWMRGLVANAALFPVITLMLIIGAYLGGGFGNQQFGVATLPSESGGFIPPLIGANNATGPAMVRSIIGLGIILLLPEVLAMVKETLGVKENYAGMALKNAQAGIPFTLGLAKKAGKTGYDIRADEQQQIAQAQLFGHSSVTKPYQTPGGTTPSWAKTQANRAKGFTRRMVGL